jgi:xanthine dehydrogenase YagT iron-sulfur-binding subunit
VAKNSRRDFLKTVGATSVAATFLRPGTATAQSPVVVGPGEVAITLTINGRPHHLTVEPRVTLLDALRMRLDLTGTKRVCDRASCGACTVIVDGRPRYACAMLAIHGQGRNIRTVEGLAPTGLMHPAQRAFCDQDAVMCGFCTPGCVMSTIALLERQGTPTGEQVRRALDGNWCR